MASHPALPDTTEPKHTCETREEYINNLRGFDARIPIIDETFMGEDAEELEEAWRRGGGSAVISKMISNQLKTLREVIEARGTQTKQVYPIVYQAPK